MKWYMRLASKFDRAIELQMRTAPCRRSALWNDVRFDGIDFVLRCRKWPGLGIACLGGWKTPLVLSCDCSPTEDRCVSDALRRLRDPFCRACKLLPLARLWLRSASLGVWLTSPRSRDGFLPLRPLRQRRPMPDQTKLMSHRNSFQITYSHHLTRTPRADRNLIGKMVNVYSQASKQARVPKYMICSRYGGRSNALSNRSNFTALDSYGASSGCEWCMYNGLGLWPASSSCRCVGSDMGGKGIVGGIGVEGGDSRRSRSVGRAWVGFVFVWVGLEGLSRSKGAGLGRGLNEFRRL